MSDSKSEKKSNHLVVIFITVFIDLVGFGIIIPLSPFLAREYGADALDIGFLMTLYSGMQFLFSPFWGRLSDRMGRRPIIILSLAGAAFSHFIFAFATELWMLYVARALAGFFGANISTAMAYIADITTKEERSKGMGLIGAAYGLGFILGPALGALFSELGQLLGDHPPFSSSFAALGASAICFSNFLLALRVLPESLSPELLGKATRKSRWERITRHLNRPVVGTLMVMFFLTTLAMAHVENQLFLYTQDEMGFDLTMASLGFAYVGLVMVFTQGFLIRRLMPQLGERRVLLIGLALSIFAFAGIGQAIELVAMGVLVTALGLGIGMINPSITGSISLMTDPAEQGESLGVNQSFAALGRVIGPVSGGWAYRDIGHSFPFWMAALFSLMAAALAIWVYQRLPKTGLKKS